jgi:hypothetical protein
VGPDETEGDRYSKISWAEEKIEDLFCDLFLDSLKECPDSLILEFDATEIPIHRDQANKFFHGDSGFCRDGIPFFLPALPTGQETAGAVNARLLTRPNICPGVRIPGLS